jgi:hypothetical protein
MRALANLLVLRIFKVSKSMLAKKIRRQREKKTNPKRHNYLWKGTLITDIRFNTVNLI